MGSSPMPGIESANRSGGTRIDGKMAEVAGGVIGEINGGVGDNMGMAEPITSELSRRSGDLAFPVFRVEVTRPISSATSRIPLTRPDSRSSNKGFWKGGGDGEDVMSRAVGSITGRGAGALVTEIVGKLDDD
jgi:hypothetical protein